MAFRLPQLENIDPQLRDKLNPLLQELQVLQDRLVKMETDEVR